MKFDSHEEGASVYTLIFSLLPYVLTKGAYMLLGAGGSPSSGCSVVSLGVLYSVLPLLTYEAVEQRSSQLRSGPILL